MRPGAHTNLLPRKTFARHYIAPMGSELALRFAIPRVAVCCTHAPRLAIVNSQTKWARLASGRQKPTVWRFSRWHAAYGRKAKYHIVSLQMPLCSSVEWHSQWHLELLHGEPAAETLRLCRAVALALAPKPAAAVGAIPQHSGTGVFNHSVARGATFEANAATSHTQARGADAAGRHSQRQQEQTTTSQAIHSKSVPNQMAMEFY